MCGEREQQRHDPTVSSATFFLQKSDGIGSLEMRKNASSFSYLFYPFGDIPTSRDLRRYINILT